MPYAPWMALDGIRSKDIKCIQFCHIDILPISLSMITYSLKCMVPINLSINGIDKVDIFW